MGQAQAEGILSDFDVDSPILAIAFGGLFMRFGLMPPFEFLRVLSSSASVKKLFVRDHERAWYHRGVRGVASDIEGVRAGLEAIIERADPAKVVIFGNSAGGYASLLFGRLLGVAEVHAFVPQTFISPALRARYGDQRWSERWSSLVDSGGYESQFGDLAKVFADTESGGTRFVIHYSSGDALGSLHANRLAAESPDVELRPYELDDSALVLHLRETGQLKSLLQESLSA